MEELIALRHPPKSEGKKDFLVLHNFNELPEWLQGKYASLLFLIWEQTINL
jgi:hypothetical protein